jgi:hypothetical protein
VLVGAAGTAFAGVRVEIPPGALGAPTEITLAKVDSATPLPPTAVGCGPMFALAPSGLRLAQPASVTFALRSRGGSAINFASRTR